MQAQGLFDRVTMERAQGRDRAFSDYAITLDNADVLEGITVVEPF